MPKCKHPEGCEKQAQTGGFCIAHGGGTQTKRKRKRHDVDNDDSDKDQDGEEEKEEEEQGRIDGFEDVQNEARAVAVAAIGHVAAKKRDVPRGGKAGKRSRSDGDKAAPPRRPTAASRKRKREDDNEDNDDDEPYHNTAGILLELKRTPGKT